MKNRTKSTILAVAAGAAVVALAISMKGMLPELYRYMKIKRM